MPPGVNPRIRRDPLQAGICIRESVADHPPLCVRDDRLMTTVRDVIATPVRRPRGRPRNPGVEDAVLAAVRDLLVERGMAGCTIAAVAERAGVGKGTIYLRWPDREALIVDALMERCVIDLQPLDTGSVRDDLVVVLGAFVDGLRSDDGPLFASTIGDLSRSPRLHALYLEHIVGPFDAVIRDILSAGIARGEIRRDADIHLSTKLLVGPLIIEALVWQQHLKHDIAADVVDAVLPGLRPA